MPGHKNLLYAAEHSWQGNRLLKMMSGNQTDTLLSPLRWYAVQYQCCSSVPDEALIPAPEFLLNGDEALLWVNHR